MTARGMKHAAAGLIALALMALPTLARAQETAAPGDMAPDFSASVAKMLAGLGLVLALMVGLYWLLRRFAPGVAGLGPARLRMLGRLGVGPRKSIAMVEVAGKVLVLGIGGDSISLLDKIEDPQKVAELTAGGNSFAKALKKAGSGVEKQ